MNSKEMQMLYLADAVQCDLQFSKGRVMQVGGAKFKLGKTPITYNLRLMIGYGSPDLYSVTLLFHVSGELYLCARKQAESLTFHAIDLEGVSLTEVQNAYDASSLWKVVKKYRKVVLSQSPTSLAVSA